MCPRPYSFSYKELECRIKTNLLITKIELAVAKDSLVVPSYITAALAWFHCISRTRPSGQESYVFTVTFWKRDL
jgi:hypothetical protein